MSKSIPPAGSARSAGSAGSARSAGSAGSAGSTGSARSTRSAGSAGSTDSGTIAVKMLVPPWCDHGKLDERGWMRASAGCTLKQALHAVGCDALRARLLLASVNGVRSPLSTELHDGDVVGLFALTTSG